jgi:hypothetical protein
LIRFVTAAVIFAAVAAPAAAQTAAPAAAPNPDAPAAEAPKLPPLHVEGFRGARWDMTEAEVKAAIAHDFKMSGDKVKSRKNPEERTSALEISVPELIEGAGTARVSYIFGYSLKKLIEVNIAWGAPVDPQAKPEAIVATANQLRQLLAGKGYEAKTVVLNARANDGSIVVFAGQDADRHTTLLRLMQIDPGAAKDAKDKPPPGMALFLSYVRDSQNPDIFQLKKDQF